MWKIIFLLFFISIALLEGLGIKNGREASFFLILVMPFFLIFYDLISNNKLIFPAKISLLFLLFLLFSAISTLLSIDRENSINYFIFYLSLSLVFIYVFNHQKQLKNIIIKSIFFLSAIFSIFSILNTFFEKQFSSFIPENGYQFVYSKFGSHNHLGDFLAVTLIISLYQLIETKKRIYALSLLIFTPLMLLSFSRSAYSAFFITAIFLFIYFIKVKKIRIVSLQSVIFLLLGALMPIFLLITVAEARQIPILSYCNQILTEKFNLGDKFFRAKRVEYLNQSLASFNENPLFGVGPANFVYISKKFTNTNSWAFSAHNLLLDILVENGLLAFMIFTTIIFLILKKQLQSPNVLTFAFLTMLFNFQTDYTHTIYSFFLLFFIFAGLIFEERSNI